MDKEVKEKKVCRQQVVFCVLVVLYVFVSLLFSLPVHAAESLSTQQIFKFSNIVEGSYTQTVTYFVNESCDSYNFILGDPTVSWKGGVAVVEPSSSFAVSSSWVTTYDDGRVGDPWNTVNTYSSYTLSNGLKINWYGISPSNGAKYDIDGHYYLFNSGFDFSTKDGVKSFLEHYFVVKDIQADEEVGGGSIDNPDFQDTAYAFTGFTANSKMTATWTGTTERSYLKDEDVEEYVRVSYGFAAKDAPDSIKQVDYDSKEYSTVAKSLTVKVSDLVPDDDSWFLRYVQLVPCYRQAGLGVWGDFYHGVPCKVYFNEDGSIDKIVRDFPQSSGDYSYKHIFSLDKYSKTIPAPELSSISHNGFTLLNNTNNEYFVDIIVESKFYGVKMEKSAGTWLPTVDTDWIYSSHYYNFADTSQIAINNDVIYFPNLFSANPENDLITDFKNWSSEYPNYSDLPTMSFLKHSTAARTTYNLKFLFDEDSNYTDSEQLRYSSCAESVFYVRYYNKSMVYGPWVRYKYRDGASAKVGDTDYGGAFVDVGQVDTDDDGNVKVDDNGNPVVSDNVSGRQDYDTGETNYGDSSFSFDLSDISKFFDYLKKIFESVLGSLSAFGSVVAACFPFLPEEFVNAVIFGICVMMFVGIIKVVK